MVNPVKEGIVVFTVFEKKDISFPGVDMIRRDSVSIFLFIDYTGGEKLDGDKKQDKVCKLFQEFHDSIGLLETLNSPVSTEKTSIFRLTNVDFSIYPFEDL